MKVVIDTNVFVSGIYWKGAPRKLIDLFVAEGIEVYTTPSILTELFRVIDAVGDKTSKTLTVNWKKIIKSRIHIVEDFEHYSECRDPDDNKFINCALTAGTKSLVSGDKDLLDLGSLESVDIVKVADFLKQV